MAQECKRGLLSLALMGAALFAAPAMAQVAGPLAPAQPPSDRSQPSDRPIQVAVEMVLVNVTVSDLQDRPLTGLEKDDFRIFENEVEQEIVSFFTKTRPPRSDFSST